MKTTLLILFACLAVGPLRAAEKIEGAFGLKLGDVCDKPGEFKPGQPNPLLTRYTVYTTPTTHQIYKITATAESPFQEHLTGWRPFNALSAFLLRKYGNQPENSGGKFTIFQDTRRISVNNYRSVQVGERSAYAISVTYEDTDLATQAGNEELENYNRELLKEADGTGL